MAAQGTQDEKNISQTLVDYFVGEKAIMLKTLQKSIEFLNKFYTKFNHVLSQEEQKFLQGILLRLRTEIKREEKKIFNL